MTVSEIIDCLEQNPVIAAVGEEKWAAALESPAQVLFYLAAELTTVKDRIRQAHEAGKLLLIHIDLAEGIGKDRVGIRYLASCGVDGIISTKAQLIRLAKSRISSPSSGSSLWTPRAWRALRKCSAIPTPT